MAGLIETTDPSTTLKPFNPDNTLSQAKSFGYDPSLGTVNLNTDTVSGQLDSILSKDNPYIARARTSAAGAANARGLLNSSMGVQAGEAAAIDAALPVATADANTFSTQRLANQGAQNTAEQVGANAANTAAVSNATADNQAVLQEQQGKIASALDLQKSNEDLKMQGLKGTQAETLANLQGTYQQLLQSSAAASALYTNITKGITDILQNNDLDPAAKQAAIDTQINMIQGGLAIIGGIAGLDLPSLLSF